MQRIIGSMLKKNPAKLKNECTYVYVVGIHLSCWNAQWHSTKFFLNSDESI